METNELYDSILAEVWARECTYSFLYEKIYRPDEVKQGKEYKDYISQLRDKISTLNNNIKNNTMINIVEEIIHLPPKNNIFINTWEILHLIKYHNKIMILFNKWKDSLITI